MLAGVAGAFVLNPDLTRYLENGTDYPYTGQLYYKKTIAYFNTGLKVDRRIMDDWVISFRPTVLLTRTNAPYSSHFPKINYPIETARLNLHFGIGYMF